MASPKRNLAIVAVLLVVAGVVLYPWLHKAEQVLRGGIANPTCGQNCGFERWTVKTLVDRDAARVNFTPHPTTVEWLNSLSAPFYLPGHSRIAPIELQTFVVRARLVGFKEEDDHDIHLILADPDQSDKTVLAEIPSPQCSGACASAHVREFEAAREALAARFGKPPGEWQYLSNRVIVAVTGVGFFDFPRRHTGRSTNGIELHPVLAFQVEE